MPFIEINTLPLPNDKNKTEVLKEIDCELLENLKWEKSRFVINWKIIEPGSYLAFGNEVDNEKPEANRCIVYIHTFSGKTQEEEATIMSSIKDVLSRNLNIIPNNIILVMRRFEKSDVLM